MSVQILTHGIFVCNLLNLDANSDYAPNGQFKLPLYLKVFSKIVAFFCYRIVF